MNTWKITCTTFTLTIILSLIGTNWQAFAQEEPPEEGIKKYGVIHNIADDRRIVKVGGRFEPEGLDKWMLRYFEELSKEISQLERRVGSIEKGVDELKVMMKESMAQKELT